MFSLYCRALFPENTKQDRSEKLNGGEWKELFIWSLFILLCSKNFPRLVTSLNEFLNEAITPYRAGLEPLRQRFLTCCGSIEFSRPEPLSVELQVSNTPLPPSLINPLPFWNPWPTEQGKDESIYGHEWLKITFFSFYCCRTITDTTTKFQITSWSGH